MKWENIMSWEQCRWLESKIKGFDVISATIHGSHLYGLNREGSDVDVKVVYIPSFNDLLLGDSIKTYNYKNDELDIEVEIKSLPSFLKSAKSCDTNCIDLLHAPDSLQILTTDVWDKIKSHRKDLYAKNMKGLIGYIKTHTHKYSNKIQRYDEMNILLAHCLSNFKMDNKIKDVCDSVRRNGFGFKYISVVDIVTDHEQTYLEVCGKKYTQTWDASLLVEALQAEINKYGTRTLSGSGKDMDTKSLSHALRMLYQLKQILTDNDLTFPLKDANSILKVKLGEMDNEDDVLSLIHNLYEECMGLLESCSLRENVNISNMLGILNDYYRGLTR